MSKRKEERQELASNAEWILYKDAHGSVIAESRKGDTKQVLSSAFLRSMRSLMALIEGRGIKLE